MEVSSDKADVCSMMQRSRPPSDVGSGQDVDDLFGDLWATGNFLPPRSASIVVVLTPLMSRSHSMQSARDVCFDDSTASCDADNHIITFMLKPTVAGAVVG